jgi:uncharacterized protein YecE (DUF72 family)
MSDGPASSRREVAVSGRAWIGCSGFSYRDWRGTVYPQEAPTRTWLGLYAERFDTVELNTTFYRLPTVQAVETWRDQVPPGFCFAVKVGRFGTHRKKLRDPEGWIANHVERVRCLGDRLGPNLLQLPPRWRRDAVRLDDLLSVAPRDIRWAVEVRDPSWLHDETYDVLARHGAALCIHDLLADHPVERTTDWAYWRFHGPNAVSEPYQHRYGPDRLAAAADRISAWLDDGCDVHAYFNNDWHAHAVADATWLRARIEPSWAR